MTLIVKHFYEGTKNYFPVPNKWRYWKFDHPRPLGVCFMDKGEHFIRPAMQNKPTT